jgi:Thrombospondin type 3 repeat
MTITRCILFSCLATVLLANTSCFSKKITSKPATIAATRDSDLDGVNDTDDKCPDTKGLAKLDGCPDMDGDGIADYQDKCPEVIGQARYQGCPIPDTDKDGINDDADECPTVFGYARYQGCLIPDTDGDGVNEEEDKCPQEAGPASNKGCPLTNKTDSLVKNDTDGDGVDDLADNCLNEPGPASNKGCPLLASIKRRIKSGKKNVSLPSINNAVSPKARNGLVNNNPATAANKTIAASGNQSTTLSVNNGISDSIPTTANTDSTSRSATLWFSFPNTIAARETKNLVIELIINEISGQAAKQTVPVFLQKNDSTTSVSLPGIATYKKLSIFFLYDKQRIQITPSVPEAQEPDLTKGNSWHWKMEALKSTSGVDTITLQVNGETAEGLKLTVAQQRVNIKIAPGPPVTFWSGAGKWIVSVGLIALSALFYFLFAARSKKKKAATGSQKS